MKTSSKLWISLPLLITSYAATALEVDRAKSPAAFALNPKPSGNVIYQQKIVFFYDFPEPVNYRKQIINGPCSYIQ